MILAPKIHSAPGFPRPCSVWGGPGLRFSGTRPIPGQGRSIDGHPGVGLVASQKAGRPYKEPQKYPQKVPPEFPPSLAGSPQKIWDVLGDLLDFSLPASPGVPPSTPPPNSPPGPAGQPLPAAPLPSLPPREAAALDRSAASSPPLPIPSKTPPWEGLRSSHREGLRSSHRQLAGAANQPPLQLFLCIESGILWRDLASPIGHLAILPSRSLSTGVL